MRNSGREVLRENLRNAHLRLYRKRSSLSLLTRSVIKEEHSLSVNPGKLRLSTATSKALDRQSLGQYSQYDSLDIEDDTLDGES